MRVILQALRGKAVRWLPGALLVIALMMMAFGYGYLSMHRQWFPHELTVTSMGVLKDAKRMLTTRVPNFDVTLENMESARFRYPPSGVILWQGGRNKFFDLCPETGCLAVEYGPDAEVLHVYPLRMDEISDAIRKAAKPVELTSVIPWVRAGDRATVFGVDQYPNGDLLVLFMNVAQPPYAGAVGRFNRDGHVLWMKTSSHHQPYVAQDGIGYAPGSKLMEEDRAALITKRVLDDSVKKRKCYPGHLNDLVNVFGPDGTLLKQIDLVGEMLKSPYGASLFYHTDNGCDPMHINSVEPVGPDAGGTWGLSPGDLVVSARNLSAFIILDGETDEVKRVVRGSFALQHGVRHVSGSTFLLMDNRGAIETTGQSRVLMIDISDGRETILFPTDDLEEEMPGPIFTNVRGDVRVSRDRTRAIATFSLEGFAVELSLPDGRVLNVYHNLHDLSHISSLPDQRLTHAATLKLGTLSVR